MLKVALGLGCLSGTIMHLKKPCSRSTKEYMQRHSEGLVHLELTIKITVDVIRVRFLEGGGFPASGFDIPASA